MIEQEYTLEEIAYSQKEDCRIMEAVLLKWFQNPKDLNFVSPSISYPFKFKKWISKFYFKKGHTIKTKILIYKKWIIGHISLEFEENNSKIFHLFIDNQYRNNGLGNKMIKEMEIFSISNGINTFITNISQKNQIAINLFNKRGYEKSGITKNGLIRMCKKNN